MRKYLQSIAVVTSAVISYHYRINFRELGVGLAGGAASELIVFGGMRRGVHAGTLALSADVKQVASTGEVGDMAFRTNDPRRADAGRYPMCRCIR